MRRNELEIEKKRRFRPKRLASVATVAAVLTVATAASGLSNAVAWGQISTATEKRGAGSLLDATQANGRFGGERYDGALKPSAKSEESRFSGGTVRGSAGNVVGVDASRTGGRFSGTSEFRSNQNFELFYWRKEILRTKDALKRAERALGANSQKRNEPRLTTAKEPKPIPYSEWRRGVRYGRTAEEKAARQSELAAAQTGVLPSDASDVGGANGRGGAPVPFDGGYDPATIWMRGRAPIADLARSPFEPTPLGDGGWGVFGGTGADAVGWVELDGRTRSELAGGLLAPLAPTPEFAPGFAPVAPSPEEKRRSYQEYLTTRLLQAPAVNPLSPISVEFRDGVATIRGIVPTPSARVAAGNVLLAEPDVRSVDNRLSFVRPDDDGPGAIVPVAPIPTAPVPSAGSNEPNLQGTPNVPTPSIPIIPILPDVGGASPTPVP